MAAVDVATAKLHLRITDALHDADVTLKLAQAEAVILDYLKDWIDPEAPAWTPETVPKPIEAAILIYLTHLYEHRGDDMAPTASGQTPDQDVWKAIANLLARLRAPTVA